MNLTIRSARTADVAAMHHVRMSVAENALSDQRRVLPADYRAYVAAGTTWVAEMATGIVGFAAIDAPRGTVWALFVAPQAEGLGVGRALHERMMRWARERGIARLSLTTDRHTRAARFYRDAGWTEAGTTADGEILFEMKLAR